MRRRYVLFGASQGFSSMVLLGLFAVLSLLTLISGARVFRLVEGNADAAYIDRTAVSYLAGKVRHAGRAGGVDIDGEGAVLSLHEEVSGGAYCTYIYSGAEGIMEYYAEASRPFNPALGQTVIEGASFTGSLSGDLLRIKIQGAGREAELCLYLPAQRGGAG